MKVLTIDGPSAAGKGTIGTKLSNHLNFFYLDTGLLYRQMAAWALEVGSDLEDEDEVFSVVSKKLHLLKLDQLSEKILRTPEISNAASKIGVFQAIRRSANEFQREYVTFASKWVVVDGRDSGTVVFPEARVKLFVTATPDVRAKRRYAQLLAEGYRPELKVLEDEIVQRDLRDQNRDIAPLKPAPDAYIIDTSEETADETVLRILKYLEKYIVM